LALTAVVGGLYPNQDLKTITINTNYFSIFEKSVFGRYRLCILLSIYDYIHLIIYQTFIMSTVVNISIDDFIFHVVHHGEDTPGLMDSTPITGFETFFKSRIKEVLEGNRFNFIENSTFLDAIKSIDQDESTFVEVSKSLARSFHQHRDGRIKPGVMILIKADIDGVKKYILIKYDHEEVITYTTVNGAAILAEISNTFSKNRDALQKSAVIDLNDRTITAAIIDKSDRGNITDFFKGFLGIKRFYDKETLTQKVNNCFLDTIKEHRASLPKEFTSQASSVFYDYVQSMDTFRQDETVKELFGTHYTDEIGRTFNRKLKQSDIHGEEFNFDKRITKPKKRKFRTQEGVTIQYDTVAEGTVQIKENESETQIIITTKKLIEESC
jgi:hypothetical protein